MSTFVAPERLAAMHRATLPESLTTWLSEYADAIDDGTLDPADVLPALAQGGVFRWGLPEQYGGLPGTDTSDAIEVLTQVAEHSVAAAFVGWGQRAFIEYLLQSTNQPLAQRWLSALARGQIAGATALSNAMKFLSGIESLQITAQAAAPGWSLTGRMPWVTNLRPEGYLVAAAVVSPDGTPAIVALAHDAPGLQRSADLPLIGLQSTNTAAVALERVPASAADLIHGNAREYLPRVRPAFVGLQCALSIGLARAALRVAAQRSQALREVLAEPLQRLDARVATLALRLRSGVADGTFIARPTDLFQTRIDLADAAVAAVQLELQASGGAAYLTTTKSGFSRRLREAAFVPIVTPSLVQLKAELAKHGKPSSI